MISGKGANVRAMEICRDAQLEIYQGLIRGTSLGEVSMSEVLSDLGSEPGSIGIPRVLLATLKGCLKNTSNRGFCGGEIFWYLSFYCARDSSRGNKI